MTSIRPQADMYRRANGLNAGAAFPVIIRRSSGDGIESMLQNIAYDGAWLTPLPRAQNSLLLAVCAAAIISSARAEPNGTAIDHPLFNANPCLTDIQPSREESAVEFHWGCTEKKIITISCVFDRTGYLGLGPSFARPGWHCNHPLPVLEDEQGDRISDVAIGDPHGRSVWAACVVTDLGDFAARVKPYHGTACYRAMIKIERAVNRTGRHPSEVADEILP